MQDFHASVVKSASLPNAGCLKGLHMLALIYLKSGRVEVLEDVQDVTWGEYEVVFERYSHGYSNRGETPTVDIEALGHYHPSAIAKVELMP